MKKILLSALAIGLFSTSFAQVNKMVMLEEFTNASCPPCASQNPAYNTLIQANTTKVISLKYQTVFPGFDPMNVQNPTEVAARRAFYTISGVPTCSMNGNIPDDNNTPNGQWGSAYAGAPAGFTQAVINDAYAIMTPLEVTISHTISPNIDSIAVRVVVRNVSSSPVNSSAANQLKLMLAMTEQEIKYNTAPGTNGETEFYEVMRKMYPGTNGTTLPNVINAGDSVVTNYNVAVPSYIYELSEVAFVTFVQDLGTKEVYQAALSAPVPVTGPDGGIADNTTLNSDLCATSITPKVTLKNEGNIAITSADITINFNGTDIVQSWTGNLAPNATDDVTFSPVTLIDGSNEWFSKLSNINGGGDLSGSNNTTPSSFAIKLPSATASLPYDQTFEGVAIGDLPTNVYGENPDRLRMYAVNKAIASLPQEIGGFGQSSSSLRWDFYAIPDGGISSIVLEKINLSNIAKAKLSFSHAYAQYGAENDRLEVLVSTDCGNNWTSVYNKAGSDLATTNPFGSGRYYPQVNQWVSDTIDLTSYVSGELTVKFKGTSNYGNALYFDDIKISGEVVSVNELFSNEDISVFPNPSSYNATLSLNSPISRNVNIRIYDLTGKNIMVLNNRKLVSGQNNIELNTSKIQNGVYFVEVYSDSKSSTLKLVIQK